MTANLVPGQSSDVIPRSMLGLARAPRVRGHFRDETHFAPYRDVCGEPKNRQSCRLHPVEDRIAVAKFLSDGFCIRVDLSIILAAVAAVLTFGSM